MSDTELLAIDGVGKAKLEKWRCFIKLFKISRKQKVLKERNHNLQRNIGTL
jgi:hypothetical protein